MLTVGQPAVGVMGAIAQEPVLLRGLDLVREADREAEVRWAENWEGTYRATMDSWAADLRAIEDEEARERSERMRELRLLQALGERFPEAEQRHEAVKKQAVLLARLGPHVDTGLQLLAARVDATAEADPAQAVDLLRAMHERIGELNQPGPWPRYVADRLWSLHEAEPIEDVELIRAAWLRLYDSLRRDAAYFEARQALRCLDQLESTAASGDPVVRAENALRWVQMHLSAEQYDRAEQRAQDLLAYIDEHPAAADASGDGGAARLQELRDTTNERLAAIRANRPATDPPGLILAHDFQLDGPRLADDGVTNLVRQIQEVYADALAGERMVARDESRSVSAWAALDDALGTVAPEELAALREAQQQAAELARDSGLAVDLSTAEGRLAFYRRHPWSRAGQLALLDQAERWLREGADGLARRSLHDLQRHAADASILRRAQQGLTILESAATDGPDTPPDIEAPEHPVQLRLPATTPRLAKHLYHAPTHFTGDMQRPLGLVSEGGVMVMASETLLARYDPGSTEPAWVRTQTDRAAARMIAGGRGTVLTEVWTVPGRFEPAIGDGRVLTRWGVGPEGRGAEAVAAFDLSTGQPLWSTADQPAWASLQPISDPVIAEGTAYVLVRELFATLSADERAPEVGAQAALALVAMDPANGRTRWIRPVQWKPWTMSPEAVEQGKRDAIWGRRLEVNTLAIGAARQRFDVVHFGNRVTVADGEVYLTTGVGVNARLDARDGMIEWLRWHRPTTHDDRWRRAMRRLGDRPAVFDDVVVFASRDRFGVIALDRDTGELRWDDALLPSHGIVGREDDTLVLHDEQNLVGVDAATGEVRWHRWLDEPMQTAPIHAGRWCYAASGDAWLKIAMQSGEVAPRIEAPGLSDAIALARIQTRAVAVGTAPAGTAGDRPALSAVTRLDAEPGEAEYELVWAHPRAEPKLWPLPDVANGTALLCYAEGWLERMDLDARSPLTWSRPVPLGLKHHYWHDGAVVLIYHDRAVAVDVTTGEQRWSSRLPFEIEHAIQLGSYLMIGRFVGRSETALSRVAAIDLASGGSAWDRPVFPAWSAYWQWGGDRAYTLMNGFGQPEVQMLEVDMSQGAVTWRRPLASLMDTPPVPGNSLSVSDAVVSLPEDDVVFDGPYEVRFGREPTVTRYAAMPEDAKLRRGLELNVYEDRWIEIRRYRGPRWMRRNFDHWLFDRENPKHMLARDQDGQVRDGLLYERDGRELTVRDLSSGEQVVSLQLPSRKLRGAHIIDSWMEGGRLYTVSTYAREVQIAHADVYLEVYSLETSEMLWEQTLADVRPRTTGPRSEQTQVLRIKSALVIADMNAIHLFTPGEKPPSPDDNE